MACLRAGLIGLGRMGRNHARVMGSLPGVELVAVVDQNPEANCAAWNVNIEADIGSLIAANVDYAVVAVPCRQHVQVGIRLAEAGIHALIEKPLAADLAGAQELADAFANHNLVGAVGHIERFNPAIQSLRSRIQVGDLGTVYQVATNRQGPFPVRVGDVGVIKDLAVHDIDVTTWINGQDYRWVAAAALDRSGCQVEDMAAAVGQLADTTITSHIVNWRSPFRSRTTTVTGEAGSFVADTLKGTLTFFANGCAAAVDSQIANSEALSEGGVTRYEMPKAEPLRIEHEQFRDAVLGMEANIVTLDEGAKAIEVADALAASAESGMAVTLWPSNR